VQQTNLQRWIQFDPNKISGGEEISVAETPVASRTAERKAVAETPVAETPVVGKIVAETPEELREALSCAALEVSIVASKEPNEMPANDWAVMENGTVEELELIS